MQFKNVSTAPIVIGTYTVPSAGTVDVPWPVVQVSTIAMAALLAGSLVPVTAPAVAPGDASIPQFGSWQALETVPANTVFEIPNTLYAGGFPAGRIYVQTILGSATLSLFDSPDGGTTWYAVPEISQVPLQAASNSSFLLPKAVLLLQGQITTPSLNSWTGMLWYFLQT